MIPVNELRLGNFVNLSSGYIAGNQKVYSIGKDGINRWSDMGASGECKPEDIDPIPITPEILEKCGFKKTSEFHPEGPIYSFGEHNRVDVCYLYKFVDYKQNTGRVRIFNMGYLHQLQNLYFVLTGKELEVKL